MTWKRVRGRSGQARRQYRGRRADRRSERGADCADNARQSLIFRDFYVDLRRICGAFFVYYQQKMGISRINTYKNSSTCADVCVFQWQIFYPDYWGNYYFCFYNDAFVPKHVGEAGCPGGGSGAQLHN